MSTTTPTATPTRIYLVRPKEGSEAKKRLVRSPNVPQVARHIVRTTVDIDVASQDDLVEALGAGIPIETLGADGADKAEEPAE